MCGNFTFRQPTDAISSETLKDSESLARLFRFPILHLRTWALPQESEDSDRRIVQGEHVGPWVDGMKEYWNGVYPQERLFQFSSVLEQCAEDARYWNAAKALLESSITLRLSMDEKDRDWNMLVALYGHRAAILTSVGR